MWFVFKRVFDFILALILLIICAIPMMIIAIAIKIDSKGTVIYKSIRMGKSLKPINVYKFRSMRQDRKELSSNLKHDEMVTKVGKFIRKTSLDELPQLFNILKGEMSFIGPRPWILEYYDFFTAEQKKRVNVLPGISGYAQVMGRNGIDVLQKINYDLEYVNKFSIKMDFKVIILTIKTVFSKENAEITENGIKEEIRELREYNIGCNSNEIKVVI